MFLLLRYVTENLTIAQINLRKERDLGARSFEMKFWTESSLCITCLGIIMMVMVQSKLRGPNLSIVLSWMTATNQSMDSPILSYQLSLNQIKNLSWLIWSLNRIFRFQKNKFINHQPAPEEIYPSLNHQSEPKETFPFLNHQSVPKEIHPSLNHPEPKVTHLFPNHHLALKETNNQRRNEFTEDII